MKLFILLLSGMLFASCMHMGVPMMQSGHQGHPEDTLLEKEVTSADIIAAATFPPLTVGQEQVLTLKLSRRATRQPVTGAEVYFHATSLQQGRSAGHDASQHHAEGALDINVTRDVTERSEEPGTYTVSYSPSEVGTENLIFHVASVDNERLDPALVIEAHKVITDASETGHGGTMMKGSGPSTSTYLIVGGAIMAAMMTLMIIRGRIF